MLIVSSSSIICNILGVEINNRAFTKAETLRLSETVSPVAITFQNCSGKSLLIGSANS